MLKILFSIYLILNISIFSQSFGTLIYDIEKDHYINLGDDLRLERYPIYSTLKPFEALLILENLDDLHLEKPSFNFLFPLWNQDQTLESALKNSVSWYFDIQMSKIDIKTINNSLYSLGYLTKQKNLPYNYLKESIELNPKEQIEVYRNLFLRDYFANTHLDIVEGATYNYDNQSGTILYGKIGTGQSKNDLAIGWFVGIIKYNSKARYIFASLLKDRVKEVDYEKVLKGKEVGGPMAQILTIKLFKSEAYIN